MTYYKAKPEYDNTRRFNHKTRTYEGIWIGGELLTPGELDKLCKRGVSINAQIFDTVEISSRKTYWFFGARFAMED